MIVRLKLAHLKSQGPDALRVSCRSIAANLKPLPGAVDMADYTLVVSELRVVDVVIDTFPTESLHRYGASHIYHGSTVSDPVAYAMVQIRFCFEVGLGSKCERFIARILPPPIGIPVEEHLKDFHVQSLPILSSYIIEEHPAFLSPQIEQLFAEVLKDFAENIMGEKPQEPVPAKELQNIGCHEEACMECKELRAFSLSDQRTLVHTSTTAVRAHLELQLVDTATWGVVTKPAALGKLGLWAAQNQKGNTLRGLLGDPESQKRILGADYDEVGVKRPKEEDNEDELTAGLRVKHPRLA
ncbi:hypothetical protein DFH09DRAFT_1329127 [Mycena vulgaris]|nr:hypothetical protein DFH09DRAFT_1329127 [Mycena vulgaris]